MDAGDASCGAEPDFEAEFRDEVRVEGAEQRGLARAGGASDEEAAARGGELHHLLLLLVELVVREGARLWSSLELVAVAARCLGEGVVEKLLSALDELFVGHEIGGLLPLFVVRRR